MKHKYVTKVDETKYVVDKTIGEITEFKQKRKIKQDDFILVFLSTIPEFFEMNGNQLKLTMALWKLSSFNPQYTEDGNIIVNDNDTKDKIRKMGLSLSNAAIDNLFSQLSKFGCILKVCKGKYMLNPKYFFKGMLSDATNMQLTFETERDIAEFVS